MTIKKEKISQENTKTNQLDMVKTNAGADLGFDSLELLPDLNSKQRKRNKKMDISLIEDPYDNSIGSILNFKATAKQEKEISELKGEISNLIADNNNVKQHKERLLLLLKELQSKEAINHISHRITSEAADYLFSHDGFKDNFKDGTLHETVVISIDIRRSTDLMLKAKSPKQFAEFITVLTDQLSEIILDNYGVFDKFTGDGILAFFPKFFSGEQAIVRALKAASECHQAFSEHYWKYKNFFNVYIKDIGLGIGLDFGEVHLVNKRKELTVVGIPVVYACRLSGANAGETLLNLSAFEEFKQVYHHSYQSQESTIFIKNEGEALAYKINFNKKIQIESMPDWLQEQQE
ncbi:adenylate/guanylate cyclase domain-containing protein [Myroides sp. LJL119]